MEAEEEDTPQPSKESKKKKKREEAEAAVEVDTPEPEPMQSKRKKKNGEDEEADPEPKNVPKKTTKYSDWDEHDTSGTKKKKKNYDEEIHEEYEDSQLPIEKRQALDLMRPEDYEEHGITPPSKTAKAKKMVGHVPSDGKIVRLQSKTSTDSLDDLVTPKDKPTKRFKSPSATPKSLLGISWFI